MSTNAPEEIAEKAVLGWLYLVRTQQNRDALTRLVKQQDAILAWRKLNLKIPLQDDFYMAASSIGRNAVSAFLSPSDKLSIRENRDSATKAAELAEQLCRLIDFNSNLHPFSTEITPPLQQAALERILGGLTQAKLKFSEKIELELDKLEKEKIEEESDPVYGEETTRMIEQGIIHRLPRVTTSDSYKILRGYWVSPAEDLKERLKMFAARARRATEFKPIVPRPKAANADQREFAISICYALSDYCRSPNYEIAAAFTSSVFDKDVSSETIKKWVQRDRDSSMQ